MMHHCTDRLRLRGMALHLHRQTKPRCELKQAMRSVGLYWQMGQWNGVAPYQYRHGCVRLYWGETRWKAEVLARKAALSDEATLHRLMLALGLRCAGLCGWG
jgi:hypothetical protein